MILRQKERGIVMKRFLTSMIAVLTGLYIGGINLAVAQEIEIHANAPETRAEQVCDTVTAKTKEAGVYIKDKSIVAADKTEKAIKKGAKKAGDATVSGAKKAGKATVKGARKAKRATAKGVRNTAEKVQKAAEKSIEKTTTELETAE